MPIHITIEDENFSSAYARMWQSKDANSFFRAPSHLRMITELTHARLRYVVVQRNSNLVAVAPFAIAEGPVGPVINSLPYYGSCSAVIGERDPDMIQKMHDALMAHAKKEGAASVTIVDDWREKTWSDLVGANFVTNRTNQFIDLKALRGRDPIDTYHQKTRNIVRKAHKLGIRIRRADDDAAIAGLAAAHRKNMADVNGIAKPQNFFDMLAAPSRPLGEHRLHVASIDGRDCGWLLNFHCGDTVEYYMPAVHLADRALQPLSLLIHQAVTEAVADGFEFWNFGGTWPTQENLRHFKIRWGASETNYSYFTWVLKMEIFSLTAQEILKDYPYFFVAPFSQFMTAKEAASA